MRLPERLRDNRVGQLPPNHIRALKTQRALGGRIELDDATLVIHSDNAIERGVEDGAFEGFALLQLLLPLLQPLLGAAPLDDDGRLIGRYAQQRRVRFGWKVRVARPGDDHAGHVAHPEAGDGGAQRFA